MIPTFKKSGLLPAGIHTASWEELEERFATNRYRQKLFEGLKKGLKVLHDFGCHEVYIDGSFVTDKTNPGDIDVCYNNMYMDLAGLKKECPEFFDSIKGNYRQRKKFGCEFYAYNSFDTFIVDFFSFSRNGEAKGLVKLKTGEIINDQKRKTI